MRRARGFTLIEVMVAIFVAAIMAFIGYSTVNQAVLDRNVINARQARVTEIQRGIRVIAQDFAQLVARPARDTSGNGQLMPAIMANGTDNILVTFTRAGWSNPAGLQRPAEQRVRYRFVDGSLVREHWLAVDPALNVEPKRRVLLRRVTAVEIRFLDPVTRNWRTEWPASSAVASGPVSPANYDIMYLTRPLAVEFTVVLEDWGRVVRLLEIPT
jgi:general secretion pathway protein J